MTSVPVPPWRPARKAATRRSLSQEAIVTAALHVVDTEGVDALSMRRVAQELDTGAASLYAHVANKEDLIALVLERVLGDIERPEPDPDRWEEQVKAMLRQARQVLASHRDLARVAMATGIPTGENAMLNAEAMLGVLRAGGLPEQVCAYAVDSLALYVTATAAEESYFAGRAAEGEFDWENFVGGMRDYYSSLPPDRFPHITGMVDALLRNVGDERFEFGLDLLVSGLARQAGR